MGLVFLVSGVNRSLPYRKNRALTPPRDFFYGANCSCKNHPAGTGSPAASSPQDNKYLLAKQSFDSSQNTPA